MKIILLLCVSVCPAMGSAEPALRNQSVDEISMVQMAVSKQPTEIVEPMDDLDYVKLHDDGFHTRPCATSKVDLPYDVDLQRDCNGKNLEDPIKFLLHFTMLAPEYHRTGPLEIMTRPYAELSRPFMCIGLAVGRGLDVRGKRSDLPPYVEAPIRRYSPHGLIPFCQNCGDTVPLKYDMVFNPHTFAMTPWTPFYSEDNEGIDTGPVQGFCARYNAKTVDTEECAITGITGSERIQKFHHDALVLWYQALPLGVQARICTKIKVPLLASMEHPFMGYKSRILGETFKEAAIINDIDLLSIAECPIKNAKGTEKYPMYAKDTEVYMEAYMDAAQLALKMAQTLDIPADQEIGFGRMAQESVEYQQKIVKLREVVDVLAIGFGSPNLVNMVGNMALQSSRTGSGAIRHMPEQDNILFPQRFADKPLSLFSSKKGWTKLWPQMLGPNKRHSVDNVQKQYRSWFTRGCCVPMNPVWFAYNQRDQGGYAEGWIALWRVARTNMEKLRGCPFYDPKASPVSKKFVSMMDEKTRQLAKTFFAIELPPL